MLPNDQLPSRILEQLDLLEAEGHWQQAVELLRSIITVACNSADAWHRLGRFYQRLGNLAISRRAYECALQIDPLKINTINNLILLELSCLDPDSADGWLEIGLNIVDMPFEDSDRFFASACELRLFQNRVSEAFDFTNRQLNLSPSSMCLSNVAVCLRLQGDFAGALQAQLDALGLTIDFDVQSIANLVGKELDTIAATLDLHVQLMNLAIYKLSINPFDRQAQLLLLAGYYSQDSFWREQIYRSSIWDGNTLDELVVWDNQGFGDTLQNICWLSEAASRATFISLWLRPAFHRLITNRFILPANVVIQAMDSNSRPWEQGCSHIGISFLPILLGGWQPNHPCLRTPSLIRNISINSEIQIGLVWKAGRHNSPQPERSARMRDCPFSLLMTHARAWQKCFDCSLVSLQLGEDSDPSFNHALDSGLFDSSLNSDDWESTAQLVEKMSLVVTIDSAMAHLCGAMGVPCIVLLNKPADWRWGQDSSDCFLYPSLRLARCANFGDWQGALDIADEIANSFLENATV